MKVWKARDPVSRFQIWLEEKGWWSEKEETAVRSDARKDGAGINGWTLLFRKADLQTCR